MILLGRKKRDVKVHLATSLMMEYTRPLVVKPRRDSTEFLDDNIGLSSYILDEAKRMGFRLTHDHLRMASISYRRWLIHKDTIVGENKGDDNQKKKVIFVVLPDNEHVEIIMDNYYIHEQGSLHVTGANETTSYFPAGQWLRFYTYYE